MNRPLIALAATLAASLPAAAQHDAVPAPTLPDVPAVAVPVVAAVPMARETAPVPPQGGSCIRVSTSQPGMRNAVARIREVRGDTMMLDFGDGSDPQAVALGDVRRLAVWAGKRSSGQGAVRGAGKGALVGGTVGLLLGLAGGEGEGYVSDELVTGLLAGYGAVGLGTLGGVVGSFSPGHRWIAVDPRSPHAAALVMAQAPAEGCPLRR